MTSNAEGLSLIRTIAGTARPLALLTALSYAAAVAVLTWLTVDGYFGDSMYGGVLMLLLAFPFFLVGLTVDQLLSVLEEATHVSLGGGWDYVRMAWPGLVEAVVLAFLLAGRRRSISGRVLGWLLAGCVIVSGLAITFDAWIPRRTFGWAFLVCGLGMIIGLLGDMIRSARADQAPGSAGNPD
ncbi:hypothetical protein [Nonomuraea fuscirosea]|uniref:hypothetical protein n=1 Tax=Nonomuraea fuscirosea TaxID=1291556 RepID=UPI00340FC90C